MSYRRILSFGYPFPKLNRDLWLICLSNVIGAFGEGLYFWVFPLYIRSLNADYVQLGVVFSALMGIAALVPIPGGFLTDRFDRKKILIASWIPWIFAPLIYSFAEHWTQLIPGTICWGASMLGLPTVTAYVITAVDDKKKLASVLSFVWASYSFSYIFAPATGGFLSTIIGMRWVLRLSTVLAAVSTAVFLLLHSQHPAKKDLPTGQQQISPADKKPLLRKMLVWAVFFAAATFFTAAARPYVPTFLAENIKMDEIAVGLFGSINYAGLTFIGLALGRLGDRWRKSGAMGLCLLLYAISLVPIIFIRDTTLLMPFAFALGGSAASGTLVSSVVGTIAPKDRQGLWVSIPQTFSLAAAFAAPYIGGYLYTISPYYAFTFSISGIPLLALFAFLRLKD